MGPRILVTNDIRNQMQRIRITSKLLLFIEMGI